MLVTTNKTQVTSNFPSNCFREKTVWFDIIIFLSLIVYKVIPEAVSPSHDLVDCGFWCTPSWNTRLKSVPWFDWLCIWNEASAVTWVSEAKATLDLVRVIEWVTDKIVWQNLSRLPQKWNLSDISEWHVKSDMFRATCRVTCIVTFIEWYVKRDLMRVTCWEWKVESDISGVIC